MKKYILLSLTSFILISCSKQNVPLKDYVHQEDISFSYEIKDIIKGNDWTTKIVKMVSQDWLDSTEINMTEWWHWLTIVIPNDLKQTEALMVVSGGSHSNQMPSKANDAMIAAAIKTQSIVATISNVPFQPLDYVKDSKENRYEDDLIAYGWRQFLESGAQDTDVQWLAHLPMTKAVIRGMDVVQEIAPVDSFVVTGASKRGWTAWTTGISDPRVKAIIPIVIDLLNVVPSFQHHWQCYGEWSPAIDSYKNEGIMDWLGSNEFDRLLDIMEPYSFIHEVKMPKFLINATGDEFFVTDSWKFYWNNLEGEKYLQYIPNTNHSLNGSYSLGSLIAFYDAIISESTIPSFEWNIVDNTINVSIDTNIEYDLYKWTVVNEDTRDFRVDAIGRTWEKEPIPISRKNRYSIKIETPKEGYKAGLIEVIFKTDNDYPLIFTSGTVVTPDTYPFGPFESKAPKGTF